MHSRWYWESVTGQEKIKKFRLILQRMGEPVPGDSDDGSPRMSVWPATHEMGLRGPLVRGVAFEVVGKLHSKLLKDGALPGCTIVLSLRSMRNGKTAGGQSSSTEGSSSILWRTWLLLEQIASKCSCFSRVTPEEDAGPQTNFDSWALRCTTLLLTLTNQSFCDEATLSRK
jgi:hypothetical protein